MSNIKKLADFIDQHKTSEKSLDRFLLLLELAVTRNKDGQLSIKEVKA